MKNIDQHLNKEGVVYIDLRSHDEIEKDGYIKGFTILPFYEEMYATGFIRRSQSWTFTPNMINDEAGISALFDRNKTLYIMCNSGNRSGYVVQALKYLGYDEVYNVGGIIDYRGNNLVFPSK